MPVFKEIKTTALALFLVLANLVAGSAAAQSALVNTETAVADAAMQGSSTDIVSQLLQEGHDVNARQNDGATGLQWAAYHGDADMTALLLAAGADPALANRNGATPLWLAASRGEAEIIEVLLSGGADPDELLPLGRRPLMLAARSGVVEAVNVLIDAGADVNAAETERGTTALMQAADQGHADVLALLIDRGADVEAVTLPLMRNERTAALGKAGDPRESVRRQVQAIVCEEGPPRLDVPTAAGDNVAEDEAVESAFTARNVCGCEQNSIGICQGRRGGNADANTNEEEPEPDGGELTPLVYAARSGDIESARVLIEAGADVNKATRYGWTPLLAATQNRNYQMGRFLIENGADVNLANKGGWSNLYLATDNRNVEGGDYPTREPDMDHLDYIRLLLDSGANVNHRLIESTETRTVFTNQWLDENGATAFLRASQSGDVPLMTLLLEYGADPHIYTELGVTPLAVAAGIGWVEGVTSEWSTAQTVEAVKMLLDLGIDPNYQADTGRTALHGAGHKGATEVARILVEAGGMLDVRDFGNTDNRGSAELAAHTWLPIDYADGLVRVGVQSAIAHPETANLMRELMLEQGLDAPPEGRTLDSICIVEVCSPEYNPQEIN